MQSRPKIALFACIVIVFFATESQATQQTVGEVERMVEGRARRVQETNRAQIQRSPPVSPVRTGAALRFRDIMGLQDNIWIELQINRPDVQGHTILAERGSYAIDSLQPEGALRFRLRQGRMFVNLKRCELAVFVRDKLISVFGTEVFFLADTTGAGDLIYLKEGHIALVDGGGQVLLDVNDRHRAWRWQDGRLPEEIVGQSLKQWEKQTRYDASKVWRKPFFKQAWVRLGLVALIGGVTYCALDCGCARSCAPTASGTVVVTLPN